MIANSPRGRASLPFQSALAVLWAALFLFQTIDLPAGTNDWHRWRGPAGNGISPEQGWFTPWPKEGPRQLWKVAVGTGFSSVSVSDGRLFTMGNAGGQDSVFCLEADTGKTLWKHSYPCPLDPKYYEGGTSVTPTVDGNTVFTLSRRGQVFAFAAANGKVLWSRNLQAELAAAVPDWGFAGSPLVEGDLLILNIGSRGVALQKATGKTAWSSGGSGAGYATPMAFNAGTQRAVAIFAGREVVAVNPANGQALWRHPWQTSYDVNAADPIIAGDRMFVSSGYGTGGGVLNIANNRPAPVWRNKNMHNHFNPCVLLDGFLYGTSGQGGEGGDLRCVDFATGQVKWTEQSVGYGSLIAADGKLIVLGEKGELVIAEATPAAFKPLARAQVLGGRCWTTPALSQGRIYCRNAQGALVCLEVSPAKPAVAAARVK